MVNLVVVVYISQKYAEVPKTQAVPAIRCGRRGTVLDAMLTHPVR
jgi:hypothetical protein